ncbi:MAG: hypothetical protein F6K14_26005 [Symploca sp. SIO2C1]|nr:hypothetical protein [Symploca sp. SIO2C1]
MEFPNLVDEQEQLVDALVRREGLLSRDVRTIASPYRIAPLGAHIDHQGGPVLGMTINAYTLMAYVPTDDGTIQLRSHNYAGAVALKLHEIPRVTKGFWGDYVQAAVLALTEKFSLSRGIKGILKGMLPGGGLSSSASVIICYLSALAEVNQIKLTPWDYVQLTQTAENKYIGLNNGILDQTSIVFGQRHHLLYIDTKKPSVCAVPTSVKEKDYRLLIAYSGYARQLTATGFNQRVQECQEAAKELGELGELGELRELRKRGRENTVYLSSIDGEGRVTATKLSDISEEAFHRHKQKLSPQLYRRASHFFTEVQRVNQGIEAWRNGQLAEFGQLMKESCQSSIEQYECGTPVIQDLQQIVSSAEGVIGSRFSGGGFGGCVVGLVQPSYAESAVAQIKDTYLSLHPEVTEQALVYLADSVKGI